MAVHIAHSPGSQLCSLNSGHSCLTVLDTFRAYAMEDPITALKDAGYTDLVTAYDAATNQQPGEEGAYAQADRHLY